MQSQQVPEPRLLSPSSGACQLQSEGRCRWELWRRSEESSPHRLQRRSPHAAAKAHHGRERKRLQGLTHTNTRRKNCAIIRQVQTQPGYQRERGTLQRQTRSHTIQTRMRLAKYGRPRLKGLRLLRELPESAAPAGAACYQASCPSPSGVCSNYGHFLELVLPSNLLIL